MPGSQIFSVPGVLIPVLLGEAWNDKDLSDHQPKDPEDLFSCFCHTQ